jgi:hypothetical protein
MTFFLKKSKKLIVQTDGSCIIFNTRFSKRISVTKKCYLNFVTENYSDNNKTKNKSYKFFK